MVTVMAIIAVLMSLGVGAWVAARSGSQVDAVAEELVSTIRQAQNNSISVKDSCDTGNSKVWGVEVGTDNFKLVTFCPPASGSNLSNPTDITQNISPYPNVIINNSGNTTASNAVYFAVPFGKGYVTTSSINGSGWVSAGTPSQEYKPSSYTAPSSNIVLTLSQSGHSRNVVIQPNGEVYEQ